MAVSVSQFGQSREKSPQPCDGVSNETFSSLSSGSLNCEPYAKEPSFRSSSFLFPRWSLLRNLRVFLQTIYCVYSVKSLIFESESQPMLLTVCNFYDGWSMGTQLWASPGTLEAMLSITLDYCSSSGYSGSSQFHDWDELYRSRHSGHAEFYASFENKVNWQS
jgi:hypothetical protein